MKKYIPIFGPQELFDGAPEDCFCVAKNVYDENVYYKVVDACLFCLDGGKWKPLQFMSCTPIAMRQIIKTPVWTVADQQAGRLPEVGAELIHKTRGICEFIGVGLDEDACWALKQQSGSIYIADKSWCQPIETPEERAKREREEWCSKALDSAGILSEMKRYELKRLGEYIGSIHDALLSGELQAPKGGE